MHEKTARQDRVSTMQASKSAKRKDLRLRVVVNEWWWWLWRRRWRVVACLSGMITFSFVFFVCPMFDWKLRNNWQWIRNSSLSSAGFKDVEEGVWWRKNRRQLLFVCSVLFIGVMHPWFFPSMLLRSWPTDIQRTKHRQGNENDRYLSFVCFIISHSATNNCFAYCSLR